MKKEIVVLWDIGNVLLKPIHGEILHSVYESGSHNCTCEEFSHKAAEVLDLSFYGRISLEQTWQMLFDLSEVNDSLTRSRMAISYSVERNEELIREISVLSKEYRLGIVSDLSQIGYYTVQMYYKDFLGFCDTDLIFTSVDYGLTKVKEGEKWFSDILKRISVPAHHIVFIDDDINNLAAASRHGINVIHYRKSKKATWNEANELLLSELSSVLLDLEGGTL